MAIFPCANKSLCIDPATPFANFSAEAPDQRIFIGLSTGFGPQYPPLGDDFFAVGCTTFCESTVSQEDADQCAARQNVDCLSFVWPTKTPGIDVFGNPVPRYTPRRIFGNRPQTATVFCPDGNPFSFTVPAGVYESFNQLEADQAALSEAQEKAALFIVCISNLTQPQVCANTPYADSVVATGSFLNPATTCWEILGVLPAGIESDLDTVFTCRTGSNRLSFFGNPTTPGIYSFAIQVIDDRGDFMVKPVTLRIAGITSTSFPDGNPFFAYSQFVNIAGFTNPIFTLESGTLPAGLVLDSLSGEIHGTPIQPETQHFTVGVTEAGTGLTCMSGDLSIKIVNPSNCLNTPTTFRNQLTAAFYGSAALVSGDKYLLLYDGNAGSFDLYNVHDGGLTFLLNQVNPLTGGRMVWSPAANEWVLFSTDGVNQAWWTSYNKTTLVQTGQNQGTNVAGTLIGQPFALVAHPTSGLVFGCLDQATLRVYNSLTHLAVPAGNVTFPAGFTFGSLGLDVAGNILYVALGTEPGPGTGSIRKYNATTFAFISSFNTPNFHTRGCGFCPDNGLLYVGANDSGADGGDIVWVYNPATNTLITTIRLLTGIWKPGAVNYYPTKFEYDSDSKQFYISASTQNSAGVQFGAVQVICTNSNTKVATLPTNPDPAFGNFLVDAVYGRVLNNDATTTPTVFAVGLDASANGFLKGYDFP